MEDTRSLKEHLVLRSLKMGQPNTTVTTWLLSTWLNTLGGILQYLYRFCFLPAKVAFCDVKRHPKALRSKIYFFGTHSRSWNKYKFSQLSWILACTTSIFAARTSCSDSVCISHQIIQNSELFRTQKERWGKFWGCAHTGWIHRMPAYMMLLMVC